MLRRRIKITGIFKAGCGIPVQAERAWSAAELHRPRNLLQYDATANICLAALGKELDLGEAQKRKGKKKILKKGKDDWRELFVHVVSSSAFEKVIFPCFSCACCRKEGLGLAGLQV